MANNLVNGEMLNYFLGKLDGRYSSSRINDDLYCIIGLDSKVDSSDVLMHKFGHIELPVGGFCEVVFYMNSLGVTYTSDSVITSSYGYFLLSLYRNQDDIILGSVGFIEIPSRNTYNSNTHIHIAITKKEDKSIDLYAARVVDSYANSFFKMIIRPVNYKNSYNYDYTNILTLYNTSSYITKSILESSSNASTYGSVIYSKQSTTLYV